MGGLLCKSGLKLVDNSADADIVIVNTCAFINPAKEEALEEILLLAHEKKEGNHPFRLVVAGCLAQRYGSEVVRRVPGIDAILGTRRWMDIVYVVESLSGAGHPESRYHLSGAAAVGRDEHGARRVGPARAKLFANLGVATVEDLLYLFPRRYEDRRKLTPVGSLKAGEWQTTQGEVIAKGGRRTFWNKKHVFEITVADDTGRVRVIWFNQPYLENYFHVGGYVVLHGRVEVFKEKLQCRAL